MLKKIQFAEDTTSNTDRQALFVYEDEEAHKNGFYIGLLRYDEKGKIFVFEPFDTYPPYDSTQLRDIAAKLDEMSAPK